MRKFVLGIMLLLASCGDPNVYKEAKHKEEQKHMADRETIGYMVIGRIGYENDVCFVVKKEALSLDSGNAIINVKGHTIVLSNYSIINLDNIDSFSDTQGIIDASNFGCKDFS